MKLIKGFAIDGSSIAASGAQRAVTVEGEKGSNFHLEIIQIVSGDNPDKYYNFETKSFETFFRSSQNVLAVTIGSRFRLPISFPAESSGSEYLVRLFPNLHLGSKLDTDTFSNSGFASINITQIADTVVTFTPLTHSNSANYATFPSSVTSTGVSGVSIGTASVQWQIDNAETDAGAFGLVLTRQPIDTDWIYRVTQTVNGAISGLQEVVLDSVVGLSVGMNVTNVSGGSLSGTPTITNIDADNFTITISSIQTFADGITLVFKAAGAAAIKNATGAGLNFDAWNSNALTVIPSVISKTVRTTATGTTIPLNGTYGVSASGAPSGNLVTISGVGIKNTSANSVQIVSAGEADGSIVMQVAQDIKVGTKVYFSGCTNSVKVSGPIVINSYPTDNVTINLDLDNFITKGIGG